MARYDKKISADAVAEKLLSALKEDKEQYVADKILTIGDILDLVAPDMAITICEADGRLRYVGTVDGAHRFDTWELEQIRGSEGRVVLVVTSKDMI